MKVVQAKKAKAFCQTRKYKNLCHGNIQYRIYICICVNLWAAGQLCLSWFIGNCVYTKLCRKGRKKVKKRQTTKQRNRSDNKLWFTDFISDFYTLDLKSV